MTTKLAGTIDYVLAGIGFSDETIGHPYFEELPHS
jgi:hypothetical protein